MAIEGGIATQQAPAEAVDDPYDWIERVEKPPFLRDDGAGESDGRDVKPELDKEGYDVAEVTELHVQCGDVEAGTQGRKEGEQDKEREKQDIPSREELVIDHHASKQSETDEEIHERDHHGGGRHDEPWEIDLGDQVRI